MSDEFLPPRYGGCQCICHTQPGVSHVVSCCDASTTTLVERLRLAGNPDCWWAADKIEAQQERIAELEAENAALTELLNDDDYIKQLHLANDNTGAVREHRVMSKRFNRG